MNTLVLIQILTLAALIEAVVQTLKPIWEPQARTKVFYVNLVVGFVFAIGINWLAGLDLFTAVGVPLVKIQWVGVILTGLLLSRGANFVHDLIALVQKLKIRVDPEG